MESPDPVQAHTSLDKACVCGGAARSIMMPGCSPIAQSVERRTVNPQVPGSSPGRGAKNIEALRASAREASAVSEAPVATIAGSDQVEPPGSPGNRAPQDRSVIREPRPCGPGRMIVPNHAPTRAANRVEADRPRWGGVHGRVGVDRRCGARGRGRRRRRGVGCITEARQAPHGEQRRSEHTADAGAWRATSVIIIDATPLAVHAYIADPAAVPPNGT